jgi:hypothetical protein
MSNNLNIERIAVGILFIIGGILSIVMGIWAVKIWLEYLPEFALQSEKNDVFFIIRRFHFTFLAGLITIVAGILILLKRTLGWTLGISMCVYRIYILGITLFNFFDSSPGGTRTDSSGIKTLFITLNVVLILLFLLSLVFFILPKIRNSFGTGRPQYLTALGLTIFIFVYRILV